MPSSVVQRVLLKICEEGKEVSVDLSDFIISDRAHKWSRAGRGLETAIHGTGVRQRPRRLWVSITDVPICRISHTILSLHRWTSAYFPVVKPPTFQPLTPNFNKLCFLQYLWLLISLAKLRSCWAQRCTPIVQATQDAEAGMAWGQEFEANLSDPERICLKTASKRHSLDIFPVHPDWASSCRQFLCQFWYPVWMLHSTEAFRLKFTQCLSRHRPHNILK